MFHEGNVCLIFKVQLTIIIINIDSRGGCRHTLNFLRAYTKELPITSEGKQIRKPDGIR